MKIKPKLEANLKIVSVNEGQGKFKELIGSVNVLFNDKLVSVGSGLTDEERKLDPETLIGKIVEVTYDSVTDDQSLRFPRVNLKKGKEC
jgi:DNA ligase-1